MLRVWQCFGKVVVAVQNNAAASVSFARVIWTYMCDVNSASRRNSKEPSLLLMSAETSFDDDDSNKGALSVNKTCQ